MQVNANTLRKGHVVDYNNKLWVVQRAEIMTPGKGASVIQIDMKDIRTGTKMDIRFRTQETVERVQLDEREMQYLYAEGDMLTFMDQTNYEQLTVPRDVVGDSAIFLQDGMICTVLTHDGAALTVELPQTVTLRIVEADPVVKGQTASSSYKPAKLENGARIMVPPHIESDTLVVVNTADGSYLERAKG